VLGMMPTQDNMHTVSRERVINNESGHRMNQYHCNGGIFVSAMDLRRADTLKKQEKRWKELGLDKAIPPPLISSTSKPPAK
jgi:hypothetical protein